METSDHFVLFLFNAGFSYQKKIFLSVFGEAGILSYICIVIFAEVVELADTLALGASAYALRVRVPSSVQKKGRYRVLFL